MAAPPQHHRQLDVDVGAVRHGSASTRNEPPSSAARSRIAVQPTPSGHAVGDADAVVDHVDVDRRAARDASASIAQHGVADDVGHRLGHDPVASPPRPRRGARPAPPASRAAISSSSPNVRANSATASTRPSWSSAVGRRSRTIRLTSADQRVDLVGRPTEQRWVGARPPATSARSSCRIAVRTPSDTPVSDGPEAVVEVAPDPAPLLLAGRHDLDAGPAQIVRQPHPADGQRRAGRRARRA